MNRPEEDYRIALQQLLGWHGFALVHFRPAVNRRGQWSTPVEGDGEGWPDIVAFYGPCQIAIEVKADAGTFGPGQVDWLIRLSDVGAYSWVLRPRDGLNQVRQWLTALVQDTHDAHLVQQGRLVDLRATMPPAQYGWGPEDVAQAAEDALRAIRRSVGGRGAFQPRAGHPVRRGGKP